MMINHDISTVRELRIYVLYMTLNKIGKVIFATRLENIDQLCQVPHTEPPQRTASCSLN